MEQLISDCIDGQITFDRFVHETRRYWWKVAIQMMSKWDHPSAIEPEDLVQELLLAAWKAMKAADGSKGSLKNWVVLGSVFAARRWLHCQRGAGRFARNMPGASAKATYPISESDMKNWYGEFDDADLLEQIAARLQSVHGISPQEEAIAIIESMQFAQTSADRMAFAAMSNSSSTEEATIDFAMRRIEARSESDDNVESGKLGRKPSVLLGDLLKRERQVYCKSLRRMCDLAVNF